MGINLALAVLEGTAHGGRHGGKPEAVNELIREAFWMTEDELRRAFKWSLSNSIELLAVMTHEMNIRHGQTRTSN